MCLIYLLIKIAVLTLVQALIWFHVFLSNAIPMLCLAEIQDRTSTYSDSKLL